MVNNAQLALEQRRVVCRCLQQTPQLTLVKVRHAQRSGLAIVHELYEQHHVYMKLAKLKILV